MSAEPTQKAGSPTGTTGAGNGKSANKAPDSAYKAGSPTATPGASANGKSANPAARSNGKSANPTTRSSGKSANKAPDSAYNDKAGRGGIAYK